MSQTWKRVHNDLIMTETCKGLPITAPTFVRQWATLLWLPRANGTWYYKGIEKKAIILQEWPRDDSIIITQRMIERMTSSKVKNYTRKEVRAVTQLLCRSSVTNPSKQEGLLGRFYNSTLRHTSKGTFSFRILQRDLRQEHRVVGVTRWSDQWNALRAVVRQCSSNENVF